MICTNCKTEYTGSFCPTCGMPSTCSPQPKSGMGCPKCSSSNIHVTTETFGSTQGFGAGKGCIGVLILGPIGWMCGLCGMGKGKTTSTTFRVCGNCGHRFK